MADNYLEKQYEQYEARKAAWQKAQKLQPRVPQSKPEATKQPTPDTAKQRRVFITGGAEGIGRALIQAFTAAGHRVAFCDLNEAAGQRTALETGADFHLLDVSHKEALEQCLHHLLLSWGDIDVIVNNVGISAFAPLTETTVEEFDHVLAVNLRPVFITARTLALHRKKNGGSAANQYGRIVNLCSTRYLMSEPGSEGYAASKGGIHSLTHALALSLADLHITVNALSPGWVEVGNYDALRPDDHQQHPSRRVGRPEDIARMCLFLCQPENDFINGENITIDGGMTKKMIYLE